MGSKTKMSIIALAVAALCACGQSDDEYERSFKTNIVSQATMDQSNIDKDAAYRLTRELRAIDPSIQSVEPIFVNGAQSLEISRTREDGGVEVWRMDPEKYAAMVKGGTEATSDKTAKPKEDESFFGGTFASSMTGAMTGAIVGNLIGNMFSSNSGVTRGFANQSQYASYNSDQRRNYTSSLSSSMANRYDKERQRERRGGGAYVSPFIGSNATNYAAASGQSGYKYSGVSAGSPSRATASSASGGRSASSGTAFSSGARGSASSGG